MRKRHIVFSAVAVLGLVSVALLANLPPFTPAGTVEIRSMDAE